MTKHFFPVCSIVLMCITSVFSVGSFIAGIIMENYSLYAIGFGMAIITLSIYRDYRRETPRKSITISLQSFNRIKDKVDILNMNVICHLNGDWVEIVYADIETNRLMNLLFRNKVKIH